MRTALAAPIFIGLWILACGLAAYGVFEAAGDPAGETFWSMPLVIAAPAIPTSWSVVQLIWKQVPAQFMLSDSFIRIVVVPLFVAAITALVAAITVSLPAVSQLIKQTRRVEDGWHYYFSASEGSPLSLVLAGGGVLGYAMAVLTGLVVFVFVVLAAELGQVCCGGSSERAQPESVCSGNVRGQVTILFDSDSAMQR